MKVINDQVKLLMAWLTTTHDNYILRLYHFFTTYV